MVTRLLLALLLLFALRPDTAAALCVLPDVQEQDRYDRSDPGFGGGAVRSNSGFELLAELAGRTVNRNSSSDQQSRGPKRMRPGVTSTAADLLSTRPHRIIAARETLVRCPQSPFVLYLPYQANPPPVAS